MTNKKVFTDTTKELLENLGFPEAKVSVDIKKDEEPSTIQTTQRKFLNSFKIPSFS